MGRGYSSRDLAWVLLDNPLTQSLSKDSLNSHGHINPFICYKFRKFLTFSHLVLQLLYLQSEDSQQSDLKIHLRNLDLIKLGDCIL